MPDTKEPGEAKRLIKLQDFNDVRSDCYQRENAPKPNGIECPRCGAELLDSTPMIVLASYPPKKSVHCAKCDYRGYRVQ